MPDDNSTNQPQKPFRIGDFQADPGLNTVTGPDGIRQIEPKAMQVLCALYRRAGETVSREELLQEVWAGRVVVEETLTRTVSQLRQAFGDGKQQPRYIQTIPKKGYRLIAAVDGFDKQAAGATASSPQSAVTPDATTSPRRSPAIMIAGALALAVLATGYLLYAELRSREPTPPESVPPSVAVLPFEQLGSEPETAYLADGVAEELLNALASVPGLRVPSRHSSFAFRGQELTLDEISAKLGVRHILEGSVRRSGDELRIGARLVDVESDSTLWSRQFDGEIDRIFEVEEEIAASVLDALESALPNLAAAPARFTRSADVDAYSLYLQGNYWWMNGTTGNWFYQARDAFEQAIALDPNFAEAHGSLAYIYARHDFHDLYMPSDIANARAEEAITRALALDDRVIDAYHARAILETSRGAFDRAARALDQALAIQPNNAVAHYLYSELYLARNEPAAAREAAARALEIDPFSPWVNVNHAIVLYHTGDLDAAGTAADEAIRIDPEYTWAYLWRAVIRHAQGRLADAVISMNRCLALDPASETNATYLGMLYLELMDDDSAQRWFEYAASLHGDGDAARLHARFVELLRDGDDDEILLALTRNLLDSLHNQRYSLLPAIHRAASSEGASETFRERLLNASPALARETPAVGPDETGPALILAALTDNNEPLLAGAAASASQFPGLAARRGLEAQRLLLAGDNKAALDSLRQTLERGWLRDWWVTRQSPLFDPVRDTAEFRDITAGVRAHAAQEAEKLKASGTL